MSNYYDIDPQTAEAWLAAREAHLAAKKELDRIANPIREAALGTDGVSVAGIPIAAFSHVTPTEKFDFVRARKELSARTLTTLSRFVSERENAPRLQVAANGLEVAREALRRSRSRKAA